MKINSTCRTLPDDTRVQFKSLVVGEGESLLTYFNKLFKQSSKFFNYSSQHYSNQAPSVQESFIKTFTEDKFSFVIFAYVDDGIVGHICMHNYGAEHTLHGAILMMGVLEEWQNKGIGKALLRLGIEESSKLDILSLELRVRDFNAAAIKLYENNGFIKIGVIPITNISFCRYFRRGSRVSRVCFEGV